MTAAEKAFRSRVTLNSKLIQAKISGNASLANEFKLDGDIETEIDDLRKFLRWTGVGCLTARASRHSPRRRVPLERPDVRRSTTAPSPIDGNKAIGLLAVTATRRDRGSKARSPSAAWCSTPISARAAARGSERAGEGAFARWRAARYFDADLRISAAEIEASARSSLAAAASPSRRRTVPFPARSASLNCAAALREGRVNVDLEATTPIDAVANLTDISLDCCLEAFGVNLPLKGTARSKPSFQPQARRLRTSHARSRGRSSAAQGRQRPGRPQPSSRLDIAA